MFIIIFVSLLRKNRAQSAKAKDDDNSFRSMIKKQFVVALALSLLFGLGWGVGVVATTSIPHAGASVTLQVIFILLTAFQGLLLFIMNCLRSTDARNEWGRWISIVTCHRLNMVDHKKKLTFNSNGNFKHRSKGVVGTLSSSAGNAGDTLKMAARMGVNTTSNQAVAFGSSLESAEEEQKRDLSLDNEEKLKYELLPHCEDGDSSQNTSERSSQGDEKMADIDSKELFPTSDGSEGCVTVNPDAAFEDNHEGKDDNEKTTQI